MTDPTFKSSDTSKPNFGSNAEPIKNGIDNTPSGQEIKQEKFGDLTTPANSERDQATTTEAGAPRPEDLDILKSPTVINNPQDAEDVRSGYDALKEADEAWLKRNKRYEITTNEDDPRDAQFEGDGFSIDFNKVNPITLFEAIQDYLGSLQVTRYSHDSNSVAASYAGLAKKELENKRDKDLAEVRKFEEEDARRKDAEELRDRYKEPETV